MPIDLPREPFHPAIPFTSRLKLFATDMRLGVTGWRLDQARRRRDHRGLLRHLEVWTALQDRRAVYLGQRLPLAADRARDETCRRIRGIVHRIDRETRRLEWATGRMQRAYLAQDQRAFSHAELLGQLACQRLQRLWTSL